MIGTLKPMMDADCTSRHIDQNFGHKEGVQAPQLALQIMSHSAHRSYHHP